MTLSALVKARRFSGSVRGGRRRWPLRKKRRPERWRSLGPSRSSRSTKDAMLQRSDREHGSIVGCCPELRRLRLEASENRAPNLRCDQVILGGASCDSIVGCADLGKKRKAKIGCLRLVPIERRLDIAISGRPSKDPGRVHRLRVASRSRTSYADFASPGDRRWSSSRASASWTWLAGTGTSSGRCEIRSHSACKYSICAAFGRSAKPGGSGSDGWLMASLDRKCIAVSRSVLSA